MAGGAKQLPRQPGDGKPKVIVEEEAEDEEDDDEGPTLKKQFVAFVRFKQPQDKGTHILLSQSDFWMKQAQVIQGRQLTTTDTGVCFFKFKKYKLDFDEYQHFLRALAAYKKISLNGIIDKLTNCGQPADDTKKVGAVGAKI